MSSSVATLKNLFPRCPLCKSKEGYVPSPFYPNVTCRSCGAEWVLYDNGLMRLERVSKFKWAEELLNKNYPLDFWKNVRAPEIQISEKIFAPMDYVGGNPRHRNPTIGFLRLCSDSLTYKASEGSLHKMEIRVPLKKVQELEIMKVDDITSEFGAKSFLVDTNKQYLVLLYKDQSSKLQHIILDFHGHQNHVDELKNLVNLQKQKKPKPRKHHVKKDDLILRYVVRVKAPKARIRR